MIVTQEVRHRQPHISPDAYVSSSDHPHGLTPFKQRYRDHYQDELTGIIPAGNSLSVGSSTWPKTFRINRQLRRALEQAGVAL